MNYLADLYNIKTRYEKKNRKIMESYSEIRGSLEGRKVFSQLWQCYAWATILGFINDRRRKLDSPFDSAFDMGVIHNNGETVCKALMCLGMSKAEDGYDCLKDPKLLVEVIEEYANGGFDYIAEMLAEKGESYLDSFPAFLNELLDRSL